MYVSIYVYICIYKQDEDANTRKFACFALGNAAFHSAALYPALRYAHVRIKRGLYVGQRDLLTTKRIKEAYDYTGALEV